MTVPRHSSPAVDPTLRRLLRLTLGPLVWALRLLVSYAAAAIWCARSGTSAIAPLLTALLTVSALALVLLAALDWTSWRQYRSDAQEDRPTDRGRYRCLGHVALLLTLVSASAWSTPPCPPSLPEPAGKAPFALAAAYTLALATAFPFSAHMLRHMLRVAVAAPLTMASARSAVRPNWPATALESRMLRGTLPRNRSRPIVRWISTQPTPPLLRSRASCCFSTGNPRPNRNPSRHRASNPHVGIREIDMPTRSLASAATIAGPPIHAMLVRFPTACFVLTLAVDMAFWQTGTLSWQRHGAGVSDRD